MSDRHDTAFHAMRRERRRLYASRPRTEREAAYRERAGLISDLAACECSFPIVRMETETGHEEWCTTHLRHLARTKPAPSAEEARG